MIDDKINRLHDLIFFMNKVNELSRHLNTLINEEERKSIIYRIEYYNNIIINNYTAFEVDCSNELLTNLVNEKRLLNRIKKRKILIQTEYKKINTHEEKEEELNIFLVSLILYLTSGKYSVDYINNFDNLIFLLLLEKSYKSDEHYSKFLNEIKHYDSNDIENKPFNKKEKKNGK